MALVYRAVKGSPLTNAEVDANFSQLANGSVVGFRQSGGIERTWESKAREIFSVKDFGAVGDDSTDDTSAIQAAIDEVQDVGRGIVYFPTGIYKVTEGLTATWGSSTSKGVTFLGAGRRSSFLKSYLDSGTMLYIGDGAGTVHYGCSVENLGFDSHASAAEDVLLRFDYCVDGRLINSLVTNFKNTGWHVGRPQNVRAIGTEVRGNGSTSQYGVRVGQDAASQPGQGFAFIGGTIRDCRKAAAQSAGIWFEFGQEHSVQTAMIESNQIGVLVACDFVLVDNNSFESSTITDTHIQLGIAGGATAGATELRANILSAGNSLNLKCLDAVKYTNANVHHNKFISLSGANVYLGADEDNRESYFTNNFISDPRTTISNSATQGKWVFRDNDETATVQRITLTDQDTTPDVTNIRNCITANTGATAITRLDNISPGQIVHMLVNDAFTSLVNGASIVTQTGADMPLISGSRVTLMGISGSGAGTQSAAVVIAAELELPGITTVGNTAKTLDVGLDTQTQIWNVELTADRAVTLSTTGAFNGAKFRVTRPAAGAFNLNVGTGPLKALAAGEWCDVEYDGSAWALTAYGAL